MKRAELVIFDMDGVLIDSERGMWLVNHKRATEELGYPFSYALSISMMGGSFATSKRRMKEYYGQDFPVEKEFELVFKYNHLMIKNNEIRLMNGVIEILEFLKNNHIPTCIATSTEKEFAYPILEGLDIKKYFDYIITGEMVENGKPAPDIYLKALNNFDKENTIIFEDAHNGIRAGIAAGINVIIVPDLANITDEDKKEAFAVVSSLDKAIPIIKEINNIK